LTLILGLETSCDETAGSVVRDGRFVLSNVVAAQHKLHERYRGVVPEIASRAHLQNLNPVVYEALRQAGVRLDDLSAIAVGHRPGLIGSLLVGVSAAKTLAWAAGKPLIGVDHVRAHLHAATLTDTGPQTKGSDPVSGTVSGTDPVSGPQTKGSDPVSDPYPGSAATPTKVTPNKVSGTFFAAEPANKVPDTFNPAAAAPQHDPGPLPFPALGLVVSGGHSSLYAMKSPTDLTRIGSTIDDAIGEAYDKAAVILDLGYPGGPKLDKLAQQGDPASHDLPRSMLGRDSLDFSFSGLKTAVLYTVRGHPKGRGPAARFERSVDDLTDQQKTDIAASFQAAAIDTVIRKLERAVRHMADHHEPPRSMVIGGGVSANSLLRTRAAELGERLNIAVRIPAFAYCLDNAAMIAGLAHTHYQADDFAGLDLPAIASGSC
jgi:tRNA N6-adenosine threonylcarbamoyltransferase